MIAGLLVDEDDLHLLSKYNWRLSSNGYVCAYANYQKLYLHRLLCKGKETVDHINKNKLDNRRCNLRPATYAENNANVGKRKQNATGYTGVFFRKDRNYYVVNVANTYVGSFKDVKDAARAYNERAKVVFGQFAILNEV